MNTRKKSKNRTKCQKKKKTLKIEASLKRKVRSEGKLVNCVHEPWCGAEQMDERNRDEENRKE